MRAGEPPRDGLVVWNGIVARVRRKERRVGAEAGRGRKNAASSRPPAVGSRITGRSAEPGGPDPAPPQLTADRPA